MGFAEVGPYLDGGFGAMEKIPEDDVHCLYGSCHG